MRCSPITRRDVWALVAHFHFVAHGDQFQAHARCGQAQITGLHFGARHKNRKRPGLGHAQAGAHDDALADLAFLRGMQAVPDRLGQGGTGVKKHADAAEQIAPQQVVGVHGVGNRFQTGGHIEIDRGRHFAQVAQGFAHQGRHWFAVVNEQGAAVKQRQTNVVVAAKRVVPRQPIHQHRWRFAQHRHGLPHLLLVGAPHAVRVDDAFGQVG